MYGLDYNAGDSYCITATGQTPFRSPAPFCFPPRLLDFSRSVTGHRNLRTSLTTGSTPLRNMSILLQQQHITGDWYSVPDLRLRDHRFTVPLDYSSRSSPNISVFAREVVAGTGLISPIYISLVSMLFGCLIFLF